LNLASAALRFGQLDAARRALADVTPGDRDRAAYHVVAGWLARAEGNPTEQERQFAVTHGTDALEGKFEQEQIDVFDINRTSIDLVTD